MQHLLKLTCIFLPLLIIPVACSDTSQPYCYRNVTETSYKVVTKTRLKNVSSKNFFKKIIAKKDTQVEIYEDHEPVHKVKVERVCCEGYTMSEFDLCEPQCIENGCPQHSKCIEPEVCECIKGYFSTRSVHDGKHYCEPICDVACPENSECVAPNQCACKRGFHNKNFTCVPHCDSGCPHGGVCIAPNNCSCQQGYKSARSTCLASCSLGDQCQNGKCIGNDYCICNTGFSWNDEALQCQSLNDETNTYKTDFMESQESTNSFVETETDIDTANNDIDPNEVFDEHIETTTFYETEDYSVPAIGSAVSIKCRDDYVFHQGECRPLKFVSNEIDCWLKPCPDENAVCRQNGTCACKEGFQLFTTHLGDQNSKHHAVKTECLSAEEYENRIQESNSNPNPQKSDAAESANWTSIFFVVLGIVILATALVLLGMKLLLRRTGEIDVEGKNLACAYDTRTCGDKDKYVN